MPATITYGADLTLTPDLVLGYEWRHVARTVLHPLIDSGVPAVTLRPAAARAGQLALFFLTAEDARAAADAHTIADVFTLIDPDQPTANMRYVVAAGDIIVQLDPDALKRWLVTIPFQSVGDAL